jgi:hypothetical protein
MNPNEPEPLPPAPEPPAPAAPAAPAPQLVDLSTLTQAMVDAYRQAVPAAPMTPPPAARDWMESLTPQQREGLQQQFISDPLAAARFVSEQTSQHERQRLVAEAAPLIASQAQTIVELYKQRKMSVADPLNADVVRVFESKLQGLDLRPLVNMQPSQQAYELDMRWDAAYGEVARKRPPAPPKPEPVLTANNGGGQGPPNGRKYENDPAIAALVKNYNLTPEQIREVEEAMG